MKINIPLIGNRYGITSLINLSYKISKLSHKLRKTLYINKTPSSHNYDKIFIYLQIICKEEDAELKIYKPVDLKYIIKRNTQT
jgi:hypothetical protein